MGIRCVDAAGGATRGPGQAAGYVWESGEPFYGTSPTFALLKAAGWEMELECPQTGHKLDVEPLDMLHERTCMYLNVKSTVIAIGSR